MGLAGVPLTSTHPVICCRTTGLLFFRLAAKFYSKQSKNIWVLVFDVRLVPLAQLPAYVLNETSRAPHLTRAAWTALRLSAVLMAVEQRRCLLPFFARMLERRRRKRASQPGSACREKSSMIGFRPPDA